MTRIGSKNDDLFLVITTASFLKVVIMTRIGSKNDDLFLVILTTAFFMARHNDEPYIVARGTGRNDNLW